MKNKTYLIYKITNKINNKIYIGQTKLSLEKRFYYHIYDSLKSQDVNIKLHNAIRKYGVENFNIALLEQCESKTQLDERERYWIKTLNAQDPLVGYNMTSGGEGGSGGPHFLNHRHSEKTKQMMSENRRGEKNANYGNRWHHTANMKYKYDGKNNPMYGKKHSEESKQKNRMSHVGKKAYSNVKLDKVIMLTPEEWEKLLKENPDWIAGNIHRK